MKKTVFIIITFLILFIIYISGPEIESEMVPKKLSRTTDPEKYIKESESGIHDMRPENEKKLIWADIPGEKTEYSIIYIHGFTASRNETAPLSDIIAERTGSNIFYTRLKGHGRYELRSQENVNISDWLKDTEEAFLIGKELGKKVIIISCSTGTALATWLAEKYPDDIKAIVMISPNFEPADKRIFLLSHKWGPLLAKVIEGEIIGENENIISPEHAKNWSYIYKTEMIFPVVALLKYVRSVDYSKINIPLEVFYCENDKIVNQNKTLEVFSAWGSEIKMTSEVKEPGDKNGHILAGDIFSPSTTDEIAETALDFLKKCSVHTKYLKESTK